MTLESPARGAEARLGLLRPGPWAGFWCWWVAVVYQIYGFGLHTVIGLDGPHPFPSAIRSGGFRSLALILAFSMAHNFNHFCRVLRPLLLSLRACRVNYMH